MGQTAVEETSAGGLVVDEHGRGAVIARTSRRGRRLWCLPKGHVEAGESLETAAIREVGEETGIIGRVLAPLGVIDFYFTVDGRLIHKTVHHYLMQAVGGELSDADIEVDEVEWVPVDELGGRLDFNDERELIAKVPELLADAG